MPSEGQFSRAVDRRERAGVAADGACSSGCEHAVGQRPSGARDGPMRRRGAADRPADWLEILWYHRRAGGAVARAEYDETRAGGAVWVA
jgi:hypothetical protein